MKRIIEFLNLILMCSFYVYASENSKIDFPFSSTILIPGYTYEILWKTNEDFGTKIKIELYQDNKFFLLIFPETENDGIFSWVVPKKLHSGIPDPYNYSIRLTDLSNQNNFIESDLFIISSRDFIYPFIIIPASAHSKGAYNSNWKTDLFFYNSFYPEDKVDIYMFFFKEGRAESEPPIGYYFEIKKGEIKILEDVVQSAFKTVGAGSIIIEEHYMHQVYWVIAANAFLYNDKEDGTYGAHIPAMGDHANEYDFTNKSLLNLKENKNFRTNIGIASKADFQIDVKIYIYDDNANLIGEKDITIPPFGFHQEYKIYRQFTSYEINGGFVYVKAINSNFEPFIYPFASVIDNRTGDVYFMPQF